PERDARLLQVLEEAGGAVREVEVVDHVEEDDRVGLAPGDRLPPDAREEAPLGEVQVELVDAVALAEDVARILVLVVEVEALARDVVALRLPGPRVRIERVAPLRAGVVEDAVVEAPPREVELELLGADEREARHVLCPPDRKSV